ncbi:MAG TPA: glycosyltransferase [Noviherbaspirillum sp.]|nr:glycosyltransferase [Noviherbaspirillum sp.]
MQEAQDWQRKLTLAQAEAQRGHFDGFLRVCRGIVDAHAGQADVLLQVGSLLLSFGFLTAARRCFERVRVLAPSDLRPLVNLANIAQQAGDHVQSRQLYALLLSHLPDHPVIRRNALLSLEYDPDVPDEERLAQAKAWGAWAVANAGGMRERPAMPPLDGRPLRVGYVSADFCQHTVGLFVKDVIASHNRSRMQVFTYSAGQVDDWVTATVRQASTFRDIRNLDDAAVAEQIRQDGIDVLVDLSGHTAGSRLTVFAYRPAPVQVSWLGYFATTGLPVMDAVLLDDWHAPSGMEAQFVERIVRLDGGRFCYAPVPFAPEDVAPAPCPVNGHVTFGSFNNTAKLNPAVIALWARVLAAVPESRLLLKWRTFQDEEMRAQISGAFARHGIAADRIVLRGASFHVDVLKEYADIDICLDTFPFTGGLTSCEALWMGVPVVTWPQGRVVSRQSYAFLKAIGLEELAAESADDYVRIAAELAGNPDRIRTLRSAMRSQMRQSALCDVAGFTQRIEEAIRRLALEVA